MTFNPRLFRRVSLFLLALGGFSLLAFFAALPASASPHYDDTTPAPSITPTPTFDVRRLDKDGKRIRGPAVRDLPSLRVEPNEAGNLILYVG